MRSGSVPAIVCPLWSEVFPTQSSHWHTNYCTVIMFCAASPRTETTSLPRQQRCMHGWTVSVWMLRMEDNTICVGWSSQWSGAARVIVGQVYQVLFRSFPDLQQWPDLASLGRRELLYKHLCHTKVELKLTDRSKHWSNYFLLAATHWNHCSAGGWVHWVSCKNNRGIHLNFNSYMHIQYMFG